MRAEEWTPGNTSSNIALAVKLVLLEEAQQQFEEEDTWWRQNRDAKELFVQEFSAVLGRISSMPEAGQRYRQTRGKLIQRALTKKTRCHVYYFHDREQDAVEVHSVCGARRERGPTL
jgi:plasmid stabilization system protein ParE